MPNNLGMLYGGPRLPCSDAVHLSQINTGRRLLTSDKIAFIMRWHHVEPYCHQQLRNCNCNASTIEDV